MKKKVSIAILFILNIVSFYALAGGDDPSQPGGDNNCDGPDPCDTPLDTWVILLVVIALILGAIHLHNKKKAAQLAA